MITGILLGSSLGITISLALALVVVVVLGDEYPRVQHEFRPLAVSTTIFLGMTIICAGSFYGLLIRHALRHAAQGLMWAGFAGVCWYYWP